MSTHRFIEIARDGHVATVTINRPDKLNALDADVLRELDETFATLESAGETRAAVLTGAGKAFVAGADIKAMGEMPPAAAKRFSEQGQRLCTRIETLSFPVIAAVNGFALGGGLELALACDFIYAADTAKVGLPEVTLAVIPGFGGTQRLVRRVGIGMARELVYTGRMVAADEALRLGLANVVVPLAELVARAQATATHIAQHGPLAVASAKRVMLHGADASLGDACELESHAFSALFGSADQKRGMAAFLSKSKAHFTGS